VFKTIQILFIGLTAALLLTACGKKEQAMPAAAPAAADPAPAPNLVPVEPKPIFALECTRQYAEGKNRSVLVSFGDKAMMTSFGDFEGGEMLELQTENTTPNQYKYKIINRTNYRYPELGFQGRIIVERESLAITKYLKLDIGLDHTQSYACKQLKEPDLAYKESVEYMNAEKQIAENKAIEEKQKQDLEYQKQMKKNKI
jgi:hypothetical protein